jgi:DNA-3-methyladenine glycosylase II
MNQVRINQHLDALAERDGDVRRGLELVGYPEPRIRVEGFETFLATIVSQQISTDAAAAIMRRVHDLLPRMEAAELLELPDGALRTAGLSAPKAGYAQALAQAIVERSFDVSRLSAMDDQTAIETITSLRGFGVWSAQIYLMFSLQRADIFPAGDLALRIALQKLKRMEQKLNQKQAGEIAKNWAPYRSAGSLLLWRYYRGAPT